MSTAASGAAALSNSKPQPKVMDLAPIPVKPARVSHCPVCDFTPLRSPTSTKRDVVLAAALTALKRVEYFLRTLRTTGTNARVILFLDAEKTATPEWRRFFSACDIEPVFVNETSQVLRDSPKLTRYYYYYQWLKDHIDEVDRVIHTDTFDVIFQSDPFIPYLDASKLYFTFEPVTIGDSGWTSSWIRQCYGSKFISRYGDRAVSCSGVTAGGAKPFLTYLSVMLNNPTWPACYGHSLDQAHHNYLLYTGEFEKAGLDILSLDCNSPFLTMHFCCKRAKCRVDENGIVFGNNTESAPVLVHQYNRWKNLTKRNSNFCPRSKEIFNLTSMFPMSSLEKLPPLEFNLPTETKSST